MKRLYDNRHHEEEFEEGDWVFLKLHPYRQMSVYMRKNAKLSARFFGPFKIIKKINHIAYKLELPQGSRIHPVFHISLLKRRLGSHQMILPHLPEVFEDDRMSPKPQAVLEARVKNKKIGLLIHWQDLSPPEATWEDKEFIQAQFSEFFLEEKGVLRGKG